MSRRGENIYKRKDGRWEGRYIKNHTEGKIRYGYVYARTYREVKAKLSAVPRMIEEEKGKSISGAISQTDMSFKEIAKEWLASLRPQLKKSSIVKYSNILEKYLFPRFGTISIEKITRADVSDFSNELLLCGGQSGKGLSPKTVTGILSVLKSIFRYAVQHGNSNVADINKLFVKQSQKPMRIFSLSEQQKLSRYLCEDLTLINLGILVSLYTGMRIGEVCALKWEDISFDDHDLYVHRTMQRIQNQGAGEQKTTVLISAPKSECSIRRIPLPVEIFRLIASAKHPENTYFLTGKVQTFVEPRTMQNHFKSVLKSCDIEDANFHALRHTFATRCVELGFDIKSLSEILGHASVNITLNRYVHPSMELKQKNMNMLSELLAV